MIKARVADRKSMAVPGSTLYVPAGTPIGMINHGSRAREGALVDMTLPGGHLSYLILAGLLAITTTLSPPLAAQDRSRIWLGAGLGSAARADGAEGFALMGEVVYQVRAHHFSIRAMGAADPFGTGADEFGEFGLLYGRAAKRKWGHGAISAGLALTGVSSCSDAPTSGCGTLGVPVVAEAALRLASVVGVGIQGFANLNPKSVYGGVVLFLQLGWLPAGGQEGGKEGRREGGKMKPHPKCNEGPC